MYLRAFRTYKSVVMYSCISEHSERTSQWLCTHVSQSSQNLQVSSYVLMYLRVVRTYKSVVIHSCISEHSELTSQWVCTHVSLSIQNLQVSSYVLVYLRAYRTYKSVVMYSCIAEHSELTSQNLNIRRTNKRLTIFHKAINGHLALPIGHLQPVLRRTRHLNSKAYNTIHTSKDCYKYSFFPRTIKDWNSLPDKIATIKEPHKFKFALAHFD